MVREKRVLGDRYELRERIGSGGMASVWLGEDLRLGRPVAVKLVSDVLADDPDYIARFRREAFVAASLAHPNLVTIYDFDSEASSPYLVMEYVPGANLAERLAAGEPVRLDRLAGDLLSALGAIHGAGVVHRDVKPHNVLIGPDGAARLTDFGIAKPEDATSITQTGMMPGTGRYMAPELLKGEAATPRSDLYSCGIVLGQCIGSVAAPLWLERLVADLTATDPELRPESAATALQAIGGPAPIDRIAVAEPEGPQEPPAEEPTATLGTGKPEPERSTSLTRPLEIATPRVGRGGPPPAAPPSEPPPPGTARRSFSMEPPALAALGALAAVLVLVIGIVTSSGEDPKQLRADIQRAEKASDGEAAAKPAGGGGEKAKPEQPSKPPKPAKEADPTRGAELNRQGYELLQAGDAEQAVPVLRDAVSAFGDQTDDVNYAYALYNLGHALRLSGAPEEAIPVLRRRLQIPNQTEVVRAELAAALEDAG